MVELDEVSEGKVTRFEEIVIEGFDKFIEEKGTDRKFRKKNWPYLKPIADMLEERYEIWNVIERRGFLGLKQDIVAQVVHPRIGDKKFPEYDFDVKLKVCYEEFLPYARNIVDKYNSEALGNAKVISLLA
jgi:hypothetical protein